VKTVRVRFAPSPTGHLHIGSLRVALFNWLYARHTGGVFLVRIEDTDKERSCQVFVDSILSSLQWTDLSSDEPIIFQSARFDIYHDYIEWLIKEGKAYRCFCPPTPERAEDVYLKYDGKCRSLSVTPEQATMPHVIRFKFPLDKPEIDFDDLIRGPISFNIDQFDDFIIMRSDGTPVYNLVVVVDDITQKITHVIRGEDHISNTPKQIALYQAFGASLPYFAHLPLILGSSGQKLSKRDAAVSVLEYKLHGYLPEALCNYLVRLGWAHGDQEVFTRKELIQLFSLHDVGKSGAIFDEQKLNWLNGLYIRQEKPEALFTYIINNIKPDLLQVIAWPQEQILGFIALYQGRVNTLLEMVKELEALYKHDRIPLQEDIESWTTKNTYQYLEMIVTGLEALSVFSSQSISTFLKEFAKEHTLKLVTLAQPLRLALTGQASGPGVFEVLALLGKKESVGRIKQFILTLKKMYTI
jgi:glutamyl-tRNA synthetase